MGLRNFINRAIDWLADQVQTSTGEKERREGVARLKQLAAAFKEKVVAAILRVNDAIKAFNNHISHLNVVRNTSVKENIDTLQIFLSKFGKCKSREAYVEENKKIPAEFPKQELDTIENYIANVDWSADDVFFDTFFLSPLGMKMKTRKQNLSLREHIHELQLLTDETLRQLELKKCATELDVKICALYTANVDFISTFISAKIIPELELVEAFFQAEKIKNEIICGYTQFENINFNYNIKSIESTDYHRHYQFVKNTVAFYVLSCCIYSTPVLTNLLNSKTTEQDIGRLEQEKSLLLRQSKVLSSTMMMHGGEIK